MLDKKAELLEAARQVFSEKGYKKANISDIAKRAQMAVGSFYKYYDSKEAVFLEVYIRENEQVREEVMRRVDWQGEPQTVVEDLFEVTFKLITPNKIMAEWNNPGISQLLRSHYAQERGKESNSFHQFLVQTFTERLQQEAFPQDLIQEIMRVYDFIYFLDMQVSEADFPGYSRVLETLVKYFVKGIFSD